MITDDQIRKMNDDHPAPWSKVVGLSHPHKVVDATYDTMFIRHDGELDFDDAVCLDMMVEHFNSRALALGLYQESEAAKLHKKFKFPLRLSANGVMRDAEDTALYTGCSKKDVFNFMIDAANAEARRQGVKFED